MGDLESEEKLSRKSSVKKNKSEAGSGLKLKEKVQEFQLWNDDNTFTQLEYERRRTRKKQEKGIIRNDGRLQRAKFFYIPSFCLILLGGCLLLVSTVDGLALSTVIWNNKLYFQITGAVLLALGLALLMVVAAYTYKREDEVRAKFGYPSLYEAARKNKGSLKNIEETMTFTCEFDAAKPSRASSQSRMSRMTSVESRASLSNLGWSFSSNSTAMSWLQKHRREHTKCARKVLRRDNSDSALDSYFARKRILSWQEQSSLVEMDGSQKTEDADSNENQTAAKYSDEVNESQALSSVSTSSSGYHSSISSPLQHKEQSNFLYSKPFLESGSKEETNQTQPSPNRVYTLTNSIDLNRPPVTIPLIPIITIKNTKL